MSAHAEIQRAQVALLGVLHDTQERVELLGPRQLDELRSEAETLLRTSNGTTRIAAEMVHNICQNALKGAKGL